MVDKKIKIGDHCTITSSKRFHLSERCLSGVPFYSSKEIIQKVSGEQISDTYYITFEQYNQIKEKFGVPISGDLLLTTRGTYGVPYIYQKEDNFYFSDGNLTWLKDFDNNLSATYLYYWFLSYDGKKNIESIAKGTAQKAVPINALKELQLTVPSIEIQNKITDILSAYDDLIENNRKQIKLLEEAAQRLYKEWFVDLRFPGHENTKIIDGVPEGWTKGRSDEFFDITIGKTPPRAESQWFTDSRTGIPWISISDMGNSSTFILDTKEGLSEEAISKHNVKIVPSGTVLVSFKLTVGKVIITCMPMCTNEAIAHFHISDDILRTYTYCYLSNFSYDELGSTSSISKAVNSKIIKSMRFIMPPHKILCEFSEITNSLFDTIINKSKQVKLLTEARDRLLPKLMSGEIEV